jgi:hypothetical protein
MFLYWVVIKSGVGTGLVTRLDGGDDREYYETDVNIGNVKAL